MKHLLLILTILIFHSCNNIDKKNDKIQVNEEAMNFNNKGIQLASTFENDSILKAIELFDKAIELQPDFLSAYWNKFIFLNQLGKTDDAFKTIKAIEKLRPDNPDYKLQVGIFTELSGDSITARKYYIKAEKIYENILDTLTKSNDELSTYQSTLMSKAINLKLLGQEREATNILKNISQNITNDDYKNMVDNFIVMNRKEIIKYKTNYKN